MQSERAFQKQPHVFLNHKRGSKAAKAKRAGKGGRRWYKDVGLGFRTPKNAIEGTYIGMQFHQTGKPDERQSVHILREARCRAMKFKNQPANAIYLYRQEVPFHRHGLYPRPYPDRHRRLDKDAPHSRHPPRIPPLRSQVLTLREETYERGRARQSSVPCGGR